MHIGQRSLDETHLLNLNSPARESLVERDQGKIRRKRAKPVVRHGDLLEPVSQEGTMGQRVAPIVAVADDERGMRAVAQEVRMIQEPGRLPVPLVLGESEVPVHQQNGPSGVSTTTICAPRGLRNPFLSEIIRESRNTHRERIRFP